MKALLVHPDVDKRLDDQAVEEYFTFGYVPDPKTIYSTVRKLESGCYLKIRRGSGLAIPVRYWDVPLDRTTNERAESEVAAQRISSTTLTMGSVNTSRADRVLGLVAQCTGRLDDSASHFEDPRR
ncbi:MAG: hypothetical protein IH943_06705 [Acidobacteria bacterium]|nr:hypothetical protein [Acidobacteriota bacterium]